MAEKFRKKPIVIEAMQYTEKPTRDNAEQANSIVVWVGGSPSRIDWAGGGALEILTLEGTMRANVGDWIIKGVKGEFYPCKPDIFEETYEPSGARKRS